MMKKPLKLPTFKTEDKERTNERHVPYQSLIKPHINGGEIGL